MKQFFCILTLFFASICTLWAQSGSVYVVPNPNLAETHIRSGNEFFSENNYEQAIISYEKALSVNPNYVHAVHVYHGLGLLYLAVGNNSKAVENFREAARRGDVESQQWLRASGYSWDNSSDVASPSSPQPSPSSVNKALLLQLVNQYRASGYTCGETFYGPTTPVEWSDNLEQAAYDHSLDMFTKNYFSHTGQDGSRPWDRAERRNYGSSYVGENIYRGQNTEEAAIRGWMNSPGHCRNIMNPNYKEMGVGHVNSYWTMKLGRQ